MPTHSWISQEQIINDWVDENPTYEEVVKTSLLRRWAADTVKDFNTIDNQQLRLVVLPLENTKVVPPKDFRSISLIAYRIFNKNKDGCTTATKVTEYVQKGFGDQCDLKIQVDCKKCQKNTCTCGEPRVTIDVDRVFLAENPWYYETSRYGKPYNSDDLNILGKDDKGGFKLLSYTINPFHNAQHHVPECVNLGYNNSDYHYVVREGLIETDIITRGEDVEILLAYFGDKVDSNGNLLVPDITECIEAVSYNLDYNFYKSEFKKTGDRKSQILYNEAYMKRDLSINRAKTKLSMNDYDELVARMQDVYRTPKYGY